MMGKYKVMMTDSIFPNLDIENNVFSANGMELILAKDASIESLVSTGKDCDAILNVYAQVPAEVIEKLEKCKVIVRTGIGYNTIDVDCATKKNIMVANVPDYCLDEVADHAFGLFLSCVRKICFLNDQVKNGIWNVNNAKPVPRLQGKTFGLFGFGNIAQRVAKRALAFDMQVMVYDPYVDKDLVKSLGCIAENDFDRFIKNVDYLSLHVPLTKETEGIVNSELLNKMKPSSILINTSRGPLVCESDLNDALAKGTIAGAALDVLNIEPPTYPMELLGQKNLVITPHAAFYSEDSLPELRRRAAEEVVRALLEGKPKNWINRIK